MTKKYIIAGTLLSFLIPFMVSAHMGPMNWSDVEEGDQTGMMQYIEDKALGTELHEKMEALMEKMMEGTLTEEEANELAGLAKEFPGPYGMMMGRFDGDGFGGKDFYGMHRGMWGGSMYGHSWVSGFSWLTEIVWLIVGVLAIAWLWRRVFPKTSQGN